MQHTDTERLIARLDNKIDKEASNLLAIYERYRNDVLKYAAGKYTGGNCDDVGGEGERSREGWKDVLKYAAGQGWGQVQYLYLVLVLKYIFIST